MKAQEINDPIGSNPGDDFIITPQLHVEGSRLYISNDDLNSAAFAAVASAATVGPAALKAAMIGLGTAVGGPAGTLIASIMAVVGGPTLVDIGLHITSALIYQEGVYIGLQARWPLVDVGYWPG